MEIACTPQTWMDYVSMIIGSLDHKSKDITIMDDLLIHSTKKDNWALLEDLLKAMIKMVSSCVQRNVSHLGQL